MQVLRGEPAREAVVGEVAHVRERVGDAREVLQRIVRVASLRPGANRRTRPRSQDSRTHRGAGLSELPFGSVIFVRHGAYAMLVVPTAFAVVVARFSASYKYVVKSAAVEVAAASRRRRREVRQRFCASSPCVP